MTMSPYSCWACGEQLEYGLQHSCDKITAWYREEAVAIKAGIPIVRRPAEIKPPKWIRPSLKTLREWDHE